MLNPIAAIWIALWIVLFVFDAVGVQITELTVPPSVRNGSECVILDCQYALLPDDLKLDSGLVVKWFFNHGPSPVYQWIPGKKPQDLGLLKGRLDLGYRVSDHTASMHRALYIKEPTTELSGDYKCLVSTFSTEDFMTKRMVVFAPEKKMMLTQSKPDLEKINITCVAQGIYPEPRMALYKDPERKSKLEIQDSVVEKVSRNGAYDIKASAVIEDQELVTPTIFECELWIPDVEYFTKKSSVFYPGIMGLVSVIHMKSAKSTTKVSKIGHPVEGVAKDPKPEETEYPTPGHYHDDDSGGPELTSHHVTWILIGVCAVVYL